MINIWEFVSLPKSSKTYLPVFNKIADPIDCYHQNFDLELGSQAMAEKGEGYNYIDFIAFLNLG